MALNLASRWAGYLRLRPISLDGEDGETLSLHQIFEQPVLHLKKFGGAVTGLAKRDDTRLRSPALRVFSFGGFL